MKCKIFIFRFDKITSGEYEINKFLKSEYVIDIITFSQVANNYQIVTTIFYIGKEDKSKTA